MNILFYLPYNQQVVYIESIAEAFANQGEELYLLTHDEKGITHKNFAKYAVSVDSMKKPRFRVPLLYHQARVRQLNKYIRKNNIDIVYSHYQESNFISVFAQFFVKAKFVITRHHSDCAYLDSNIKEKIGDFFINKLAKVYISPSELVYNQMVEIEGTKPGKIKKINYGYNFENFKRPDQNQVKKIKVEYDCKFLLIKAARFIPEKRHYILLHVISKLVNEGFDIKLMLLGKGPIREQTEELVKKLNLVDRIFFLGYKTNVQDYFSAADLLVHLSLSEASNSAIKEAALTETPVVVCSNVGDFSEYIFHQKNGFILEKENPYDALYQLLKERYTENEENKKLGKQLKQDVMERFSIETVFPSYLEINKQLTNGEN